MCVFVSVNVSTCVYMSTYKTGDHTGQRNDTSAGGVIGCGVHLQRRTRWRQGGVTGAASLFVFLSWEVKLNRTFFLCLEQKAVTATNRQDRTNRDPAESKKQQIRRSEVKTIKDKLTQKTGLDTK